MSNRMSRGHQTNNGVYLSTAYNAGNNNTNSGAGGSTSSFLEMVIMVDTNIGTQVMEGMSMALVSLMYIVSIVTTKDTPKKLASSYMVIPEGEEVHLALMLTMPHSKEINSMLAKLMNLLQSYTTGS